MYRGEFKIIGRLLEMRNNFKRLMGICLILVMILGMMPFTAMAEATSGDITVSLTLDTRALKRNEAMLIYNEDNNYELFDSNYETFSVTIPIGSSVYDVLTKAATKNNFTVDADMYGDDYFVTSIGYIGEDSFSLEQQEEYLLRVEYFGSKFLASGWVYNVNGIYPDVSMGKTQVADGDDIRISYTITGSWDIATEDFLAADYPNLDLNFLDAFEELKASNPTGAAATFVSDIEEQMTEIENDYDGFTSRWYATSIFTGPQGLQAEVDAFLQ